MLEFLGHLHPLLVHLPIGILLIALLLQWLSTKEKYKTIKPAVAIALLTGSITALFSCITGYILSTTDDYDQSLVSWHMWMAIGTTLISFMLYAKETNHMFAVNKKLLFVSLLILITITGHLGGSLTHGSDYLTEPLRNFITGDSSSSSVIKPLANVQEAAVYDSVIEPIFATRCYSCHGPNKQKGGLRMDDSLRLMKGGEDGIIVKAGSAENSDLIKRITLSLDNEDHMPPKEKPQLSKSQVALLHWWIDNGAAFNKKVKDIPQTPSIIERLTALQSPEKDKQEISFIPAEAVKPADTSIISKLKQQHILVLPVAQNNNYLMANFVTDSIVTNDDLNELLKLKMQLIWLKLSGTNITDVSCQQIKEFSNLTRLDISNTAISDAGIQQLASLKKLQYLNLVNTKVTAKALSLLKNLAALNQLYLYKTMVDQSSIAQLQKLLPKTIIDTGGYTVPTFATDTVVLKAKPY